MNETAWGQDMMLIFMPVRTCTHNHGPGCSKHIASSETTLYIQKENVHAVNLKLSTHGDSALQVPGQLDHTVPIPGITRPFQF